MKRLAEVEEQVDENTDYVKAFEKEVIRNFDVTRRQIVDLHEMVDEVMWNAGIQFAFKVQLSYLFSEYVLIPYQLLNVGS